MTILFGFYRFLHYCLCSTRVNTQEVNQAFNIWGLAQGDDSSCISRLSLSTAFLASRSSLGSVT